MTSLEVLRRLGAAGGGLRVYQGNLILKRPSDKPLPPGLVAEIKANREELIALLSRGFPSSELHISPDRTVVVHVCRRCGALYLLGGMACHPQGS